MFCKQTEKIDDIHETLVLGGKSQCSLAVGSSHMVEILARVRRNTVRGRKTLYLVQQPERNVIAVAAVSSDAKIKEPLIAMLIFPYKSANDVHCRGDAEFKPSKRRAVEMAMQSIEQL